MTCQSTILNKFGLLNRARDLFFTLIVINPGRQRHRLEASLWAVLLNFALQSVFIGDFVFHAKQISDLLIFFIKCTICLCLSLPVSHIFMWVSAINQVKYIFVNINCLYSIYIIIFNQINIEANCNLNDYDWNISNKHKNISSYAFVFIYVHNNSSQSM